MTKGRRPDPDENPQQPSPYRYPQGQQPYQTPEAASYYPPQPNYAANQSYPAQGQGYPQQPTYGQQPPYGQQQYPPQPTYGQEYEQQQPNYGAQPPQISYVSHPGPPPVPRTEEEKGVMGALAGGVAGGYAGHKMHHGVLGALGGAFVGHKLEDAYKHHHNKPSPSPSPSPAPPQYAPHQQYTPPPPPPPPQYAPHQQYTPLPPPPPPQQYSVGGLALRGNFSASSTSITLDGDYDLIASCATTRGDRKLSSISLNQVITNEDGNFKWVHSGGNFAASARNVRLSEGGTVLEAELATRDGRWNHAKTWLNEMITNEDGDLKYVG